MNQVINYQSHEELIQREKSLPVPQSIDELVSLDSRQFVYVAKTFGKAKIVDTINDALIEICKYMNFEISADMTTKAAEIISEEYPLCKIADMKMFERFMLKGGAGKLFRLDVPTLIEAFAKYYAERAEVFAAHRENEHLKRKKSIDDGDLPSNERMKELLEVAKLKSVDKFEQKKEEQAIRSMTPQEICQRHGIDYDKLVEEQNEIWLDTWKKSPISDEMEYSVFRGLRKNILDGNIKSGKVFDFVKKQTA